jgi:hypothetical protein
MKDESKDLPMSDASLDGATANVMGGMSEADARRGFKVLDKSHDELGGVILGPRREDEMGNTFEGDPWERGGFLNRPTTSTER